MSRLRSHLKPRLVLALFALVLSASLISLASTATKTSASPSEVGTPDQQASVRTSREVATLPLRSSCTVVPDKELFITDISVVDDCVRTTWGPCISSKNPPQPATQGAWTFGTRMASLAGTTNAATLSTFTLNWLNHWLANQTINGDPVAARPNIQTLVINPWLAASGGTTLDMKKAPFRLLAIVARLDLRENAGYSGGSSAGEGRFVYNLLDANGNTTQFLAIFEYGLDAADCTAVIQWANTWHGLGAYAFGPGYNAALQAVTDSFATIGASPGKPNGSAINQVRTDEIQLVLPSQPWELREFKLSAKSVSVPAPLVEVTVAQTPASSPTHNLQNTTAISTYINSNTAAILANNYVVPLLWSGAPFRAGASPNLLNLGWDGPAPSACGSIADPNARAIFAVNTCNGCHGTAETGTTFKQVEPRNAGTASALSGFLTGTSKTDICGIPHNFNDIDRRRVDLCQLLNKTCAEVDSEPVVSFVH
jgi:hypothetical protein